MTQPEIKSMTKEEIESRTAPLEADAYTTHTPPRWPSGQGVRLESGRSRVRIPFSPEFFRGRVILVTRKLALQWLPCQAPGVIGSALGQVGPVSVYRDWVR